MEAIWMHFIISFLLIKNHRNLGLEHLQAIVCDLQHLTYNINGVSSSVCCSTILHTIAICPFFFPNAQNRGGGGDKTVTNSTALFKTHRSHYLWHTTHSNLLMVKGYFKSLSQINTLPVLIILTTDVPLRWNTASPVKMFWVKNIMYCSQKPVTNMHFLIITIFTCLNLSNFEQ
jgi:hypothetical protein